MPQNINHKMNLKWYTPLNNDRSQFQTTVAERERGRGGGGGGGGDGDGERGGGGGGGEGRVDKPFTATFQQSTLSNRE